MQQLVRFLPCTIVTYTVLIYILLRDVDIKLRSLQEVTQQDQSPVCVTAGHWSETIVVDQIGTPSPSERKITIRIRTRNGVERFSIRMVM